MPKKVLYAIRNKLSSVLLENLKGEILIFEDKSNAKSWVERKEKEIGLTGLFSIVNYPEAVYTQSPCERLIKTDAKNICFLKDH